MIDSCYVGDVRDGLRSFIAAGIRAQTCVTSPPYFGLRDYGTAQWDGGDTACDHDEYSRRRNSAAQPGSGSGAGNGGALRDKPSRECKCGARRIDRQIGLEPTIAEYVQTMVDVFRLVRDALADDGTLWLNLGDSYAGGGNNSGNTKEISDKQGSNRGNRYEKKPVPDGLKPKDLCGIPWRVAFALQADGWYLRSDIIWAKQNPMPESVTDRPTKAHEYLFLLSKREKYYYDAAAIAEPATSESGAGLIDADQKFGGVYGSRSHSGWRGGNGSTRNRRTVWTIATEPYADAHFATFPTALVEPCILAGSRAGDVILDPFMGSGTVAQVAQSLGRRWIGCELNPEYAEMQKRRAAQLGMMYA